MIVLWKATSADVAWLEHWDTQQHVIDSDPDDDWNWRVELNRDLTWREQLIAERNGVPIGFIQIIDPLQEESNYWGNVAPNKRAIDVWIGEEKNLNKGYGTTMMQLAIEKCFENELVDGILIDPLKTNTRAHNFYRRLGFKFVEERKFYGVACLVFELRRNNYQKTNQPR